MAPPTRTATRNVAAVEARFATTRVETTADFADGTVYKVVAVVAAGFDCPRTFLAISYAPISMKMSAVGSVVTEAHDAVEPSVVKYLPALPV